MSGAGVAARLDAILDRFTARHPGPSVVFALESLDGVFRWSGGRGEQSGRSAVTLTEHDPYFLASATKLFVTALVLQLRSEGALELDDPVVGLLDPEAIDGIHVHRGRDRVGEITVRHLLSHTSGLADYFEDRQSDGSVLMADVLTPGGDRGWTREDVLEIARERMPPAFAPGARCAHYSDTNFQVLGMILESVTGRTFAENLTARVTGPLGLDHTQLFGVAGSPDYDDVAAMYDGGHALRIPQAMASVGEDGGLVSSASDGIAFLRAFFSGALFPRSYLNELGPWRRVFFPLEYGVGVMRFRLPRVLSPFAPAPALLGHSGVNGAVLFHEPARGLLVSGTVNQLTPRSRSYRLMLDLVVAASSA